MGEAKRRKAARAGVVYHHTSTLRTNLIWMSGVIELEGRGEELIHPKLDNFTFSGNASLRRPMKDLPPVAWFTTQVAIPNCLRTWAPTFRNRDGSPNQAAEAMWQKLKPSDPETTKDVWDGITLQRRSPEALRHPRVALGFPIADIPVTGSCEVEENQAEGPDWCCAAASVA
jgi:hypothetical protein